MTVSPANVSTVIRLVFSPQVHHVTIAVGPTPAGRPFAARFEGPASRITTAPDWRTITIIRRGPLHPLDFTRRSADITLVPGGEWDIEIQGDATHVRADLTGVRLNSLSVSGALARSAFLLPETGRVVPIRIGGGVRWTRFSRPAGTRVALRGEHGSTGLSLDGEWAGTLATCDWDSNDADPGGSAPGYEITLGAGRNHLTIDQK